MLVVGLSDGLGGVCNIHFTMGTEHYNFNFVMLVTGDYFITRDNKYQHKTLQKILYK